MSKNFWDIVNRVITEADIILEVIDSRAVTQTRNIEIEDKVRKKEKIIIYVLNKCDLAVKEELDKVKKTLVPSVFISCKEYYGINMLKERIIIEGKRAGLENPKVGVLGYPNMGKSSVINALTGTGKAKTSSTSGFTRGKQYINTRKFQLIDTPGVIPYGEKDAVKNAMTGINTKSKDPESDVISIMNECVGLIESYYDVPVEDDKEEALKKIAVKLNCMRKGNLPDTVRASETIIKSLRDGKIQI